MAKSFKYKDNNFLDSTGIVHNKTLLSEILNKLQIYSTEEQKIGFWIDGKPLFRKVVPLNEFAVDGESITNHNISNIDYIVNSSIHWYDTQDKVWYSNFKDTTGTYYIIFNGVSSTQISIKCNGGALWNARAQNRYAILEYTKK